MAGAERDVGAAAFAVAFQRIARDRRAEEQKVVEMRDLFSQSPLTRSSTSEGEKGSEGPDG